MFLCLLLSSGRIDFVFYDLITVEIMILLVFSVVLVVFDVVL